MSSALATSRRLTASKIAPSVSASRWSRVSPSPRWPWQYSAMDTSRSCEERVTSGLHMRSRTALMK
eukprot:207743-Lingulodinium_polyedra.AAC.1